MRLCNALRITRVVVLMALVLPAWADVVLGQGKTAVPDPAAVAKARELVRDVYGKERDAAKTSDQRIALAKKMLDTATGSKSDPAAHFVLLGVARDLAAAGGDVLTAMDAVDRIVQTFDVDPMGTKLECLQQVAGAAKATSQRAALAEHALSLIDSAVAEEDFQTAYRFGEIAQEAARRARAYSLLKEIVARVEEVKHFEQAYAAYQQVATKLSENPTDPDANLAAGRYLCLVQGDWERGVPMLALGSDLALKGAAVRELKAGDSPDAQVACGDAWWDLAEGADDEHCDSLRLRAGHWYERARPNLTSGLARVKIENRLGQIAKLERPPGEAAASSAVTTGEKAKPQVFVLCGGSIMLFVNGELVHQGNTPGEPVILSTAVAANDVIAVRVLGKEAAIPFLLIAQQGDRVFTSSLAWRWTNNETAGWKTARRVRGSWRPVEVVREGPYKDVAGLAGPAEAICGHARPTFLHAVVQWTKQSQPVSLEKLAEEWAQLQKKRELKYYSRENIQKGKIKIWHEGRTHALEAMSESQCLDARSFLEGVLGSGKCEEVPGGEEAVRKMLRGLQYALGPNEDRSKALQWKVVCILATNVRLEWKDKAGNPHQFESTVENPQEWLAHIDREVGRLSDIVFQKSWGRVHIVSVSHLSRAPITSVRVSRDRYWFTATGLAPALKDALGSTKCHSVFVWVPKDGRGEFPPMLGAAATSGGSAETNGAVLVVFHTTGERLAKEGGWASPGGGGALHEFWHNIQSSLRGIGFKGFLPTNHSEEHFKQLKEEAVSLGLPEGQNRYDELLGLYPTGTMCRELAK